MNAAEWAKHPLALEMLEAPLQRNIESLLTHFGWRHYHTHDSRRSPAGFLDLCAVRARDGRLLFAELKQQKRYPTPAQRGWIEDLRAIEKTDASSVTEQFPEVYVWRPADYLAGDVERILR